MDLIVKNMINNGIRLPLTQLQDINRAHIENEMLKLGLL